MATRTVTPSLEIPIPVAGVAGTLVVPAESFGLVLVVHEGWTRHRARNLRIASLLHRRDLATLLLDLRPIEESMHAHRDVELLASRLVRTAEWAREDEQLSALPIGYLGSSVGASVIATAAAREPALVNALVAYGGTFDFVNGVLAMVRAPTLLLVGDDDEIGLDINRAAMRSLGGPARLLAVPGSGDVIETTRALEAIGRLAGDWFRAHLERPSARPALEADVPR